MRISNLVAVLVAPLLLGGAFLQESAVQETPSVVTCAPGISAGEYVSETDTYYFGRGDSPARIAESYGTPRWQAFLGLNPYLEGRITENVTVGNRAFRYYASVDVCEPLVGLQVLGLVPADLSVAETAVVPTATLGPIQVEQTATGPNWWMWAFIIAFAAIVYLLFDRRLLERIIAGLRKELQEIRGWYEQMLDGLHKGHEERLAHQREVDFAARRAVMAPLPDEVEDGVMAGPPVRYEGVTRENRDEVLEQAARNAYERLHRGATTDGLVFERRNTRRVLISSRPGETVQMTFGNNQSREVTLVREPGWVFDAVIRRGDEVIQELENVAVVGFCANTFEYRRSWIENTLVEPYEHAAVHTIPDWGAVEAERANRHLTFYSVGGRVVATVGGEPVLMADYFELQTDGEVKLEDGEITIGSRTRLVPRNTTKKTEEFTPSNR